MANFLKILLRLLLLSILLFVGVHVFYKSALERLRNFEIQHPTRLTRIENRGNSNLYVSGTTINRNAVKAARLSVERPGGGNGKGNSEIDGAFHRLVLLGTVSDDMESGFAVIMEKDLRRQEIYRVGDLVYGGVIARILKGRVLIRCDGKEVILTMEEKTSSKEEAEIASKSSRETNISVMVDFSDLARETSGISQSLSHLNIQPRLFGSGEGGLQILDIEPGSLFEKLGIKSGDVIQEIDQIAIKNPHEIVSMFELLRPALPSTLFDESGIRISKIQRLMDRYSIQASPELISLWWKLRAKKDISMKIKRLGKKLNMTYRFR